MKKSEIVTKIAKEINIGRTTCETVIDAFLKEIESELVSGEKVSIHDFATFEITERAARRGKNPRTNEITVFPEVKTIKCRMSSRIKDEINDR